MTKDGQALDVYYSETSSRIPKELAWAGDGIQIWLQLVYHVYRVRERQTVILDEPDVYLHPDLQRRLVRMLEASGRQVILATHSAEIVTEADPRHVTIIDKTRKRARRGPDDASLAILSNALGTAFNLRLSRALRSKVALFVEGKDMVVLRRFARTLQLASVENELGVTIIPLDGYSRSDQVGPFAWLCKELLPEAIQVFVLLDRDYRPDEVIERVEKEFAKTGITAHVWRRKELESYILDTQVISRVTSTSVADVMQMLAEATADLEDQVFGQLLSERLLEERGTGKHASTITTQFKKEFDKEWADPRYRLQVAPPKDILHALNKALAAKGSPTVSIRGLATAHKLSEIPEEAADFLRVVEAAILA